MRASYQLNQEKLEYNFQVLKKRDDENTITNSQQKRRLTKMQDQLNSLRSKLEAQEKKARVEGCNLREDYRRLLQQYADFQKKKKHFEDADNKKFREVWEMPSCFAASPCGRPYSLAMACWSTLSGSRPR